ncbi:hypothetical protein OPV22_013292 [Ensete ventricosum]|uniref:Uncharacterized protein n=1 Tax=Ensete ventricosum TaxID=4639 RepID=A0AAV8R3I3_ENSVE|nr:hypothetical protein OPV22_013292 [Ensete ventricosum]
MPTLTLTPSCLGPHVATPTSGGLLAVSPVRFHPPSFLASILACEFLRNFASGGDVSCSARFWWPYSFFSTAIQIDSCR